MSILGERYLDVLGTLCLSENLPYSPMLQVNPIKDAVSRPTFFLLRLFYDFMRWRARVCDSWRTVALSLQWNILCLSTLQMEKLQRTAAFLMWRLLLAGKVSIKRSCFAIQILTMLCQWLGKLNIFIHWLATDIVLATNVAFEATASPQGCLEAGLPQPSHGTDLGSSKVKSKGVRYLRLNIR